MALYFSVVSYHCACTALSQQCTQTGGKDAIDHLNAGKEPPIFYYRDKDQKEIDLLLYQNGMLSPIEIKKSASPGKTAIKNFKVLEPVTREPAFGGLESLNVEIGTGSVVCMANDLLPLDEKNWYVPVWLI